MFFFEKKNQKTFALWRAGPGERTRQRTKVFCFFSSEKKTLLPYARHQPLPVPTSNRAPIRLVQRRVQ
jgi:hypothetical protein